MVHSELLLTNITSYIHHSSQAGRREQKFKCVINQFYTNDSKLEYSKALILRF